MLKFMNVNIIISTNCINFASFLADIISTVEFDNTGEFLASGDNVGRVVLFQRNNTVNFDLLCLLSLIFVFLKKILEKIL